MADSSRDREPSSSVSPTPAMPLEDTTEFRTFPIPEGHEAVGPSPLKFNPKMLGSGNLFGYVLHHAIEDVLEDGLKCDNKLE